MRIFVFGNINSGKSYIIDSLKILHPEYRVLSIDSYRKKYGENTWDSEINTQNIFVDDVFETDNIIVECTGLGPLGEKLAKNICNKTDIILFNKTPLETCLERVPLKDLTLTPYPPVEEQIEITIAKTDALLNNGTLHALWQDKVMYIYEVNSTNSLESIPLNLFKHFSNVIKLLYTNKTIETIYPFGSFARNEIVVGSDIDCFVVTKLSLKDLIRILEPLNNVFIDCLGNKITIRHSDASLIELLIIDTLPKGEKFLRGSLIHNPTASIIKISKEDYNYITNLDFKNNLPVKSVGQLLSNMMYFVYSLPPLIKKDNKYKYYFHFNILLHDYIRINEILDNNITFNYLPKVEISNYKHLLNLNMDDLLNHYTKLVNYIKNLLERINSDNSKKHLSHLSVI